MADQTAPDYYETLLQSSKDCGHHRCRGAKRTKSLNIKLSESVNNLLEDWCDKTGQSKTVAVERALMNYCKGYTDGLGESTFD